MNKNIIKIKYSNYSKSVTGTIEITKKELETIKVGEIIEKIHTQQNITEEISITYKNIKLHENKNKLFKSIQYNEKDEIKIYYKKQERKQIEEKNSNYLNEIDEDVRKGDENDAFNQYGSQMIKSMLQQGPYKKMLEEHPEMSNFLSDEKELQNILKIAQNPQLMKQFMSGADNMLNQIENMPGGHNELEKALHGYDAMDEILYGPSKVRYNPEKRKDDYKQEEILTQSFNIFGDVSQIKNKTNTPNNNGNINNNYINGFGGYQNRNDMYNINQQMTMNPTPRRQPMNTLNQQTTMNRIPRRQPIVYQDPKTRVKNMSKEEKEKIIEINRDVYDDLIVMGLDDEDLIIESIIATDGSLEEVVEYYCGQP